MHKCETCKYCGEHQEMGFRPVGVCHLEQNLLMAIRAYNATECPFMDGQDTTAPTTCDRGCSTCANDGFDMPQCRECTEHPGYPWYKRKDGGAEG